MDDHVDISEPSFGRCAAVFTGWVGLFLFCAFSLDTAHNMPRWLWLLLLAGTTAALTVGAICLVGDAVDAPGEEQN